MHRLRQVDVGRRIHRGLHVGVLDEIAQVRILVVADRRLHRDRLLGDLHHLADLVLGHLHFLGQLLRRRLAAVLLEHLAGNAVQLVYGLDHVHRDADRARLVGDRTRDRLPDPPRRISRELEPAAVLELVHRLHQADVALLDQVQELQPAVGVLLGDRDHQAQVGLHHLLLGLARLGLAVGHRAVDVLQLGQRHPHRLLKVHHRLLLGDDLVLHLAQAGCPLLLALEHLVHPAQVGLVAVPHAQEIAARHLRHPGGKVQHLALVAAHFVGRVAKPLHQHVHVRQRQLEDLERRGHLLAQLGHGLVLGTVLGVGALELGVHGGQLVHLLRDLLGIGAGGRGLLLFLGVVLVVDVLVGIGVLINRHVHRGLLRLLFLLGGGGQLFQHVVVEAGDDLGQALLAFLVQRVVLEELLDGPRKRAQRGQHLVEAFLDALGDLDLALAGEQLHGAHLAHVHAHRVGGAAALGVQGGQRGGGLLGRGVVHVTATVGLAGQQQLLGIGRGLVDLDAHAVDHADDVFQLLRIDQIVGQVVVDLGIGQVALLQPLADQLLDVGLGSRRSFVGHKECAT